MNTVLCVKLAANKAIQEGQTVRQGKLVISYKVKDLVGRNSVMNFLRSNPPPVSSVAPLAERCYLAIATKQREQEK